MLTGPHFLVSTPRWGPEHGEPGDDTGGSPGTFGMALFLVSLAVLFVASLVGFAYFRIRSEVWPPDDLPPLPNTLWISTILLLISGGTMHWALLSVRRNALRALQRAMVCTTLLGCAFVAAQGIIWLDLLLSRRLPLELNLFSFFFYLLTGVHAAHVIGGLIPLVWVTIRAYRYHYTAQAHDGVWYCAMYWHFLDAVWIVLFVALVLLP